MDDLWHVEIYYRNATLPAHRFVAVGKDEAMKRMEDGLQDEAVGGVVAYRPPLQVASPREGSRDVARS